MIKNIPRAKDFENVGFECLVQAYKSIYQIDNGELIPNVTRKNIWKYNTIVLKTSIVLIHQGIEALMKSGIAAKSPLLLLGEKRSDWKTLPGSADIDFADMHTISGDDLIRTFFAITKSGEIQDNFTVHFEKVRVLRNKIVHGVGNQEIEPEEVLKLILWTFTHLYGKGSFWRALQEKFYDHPGHEVGDSDIEFEEAQQYYHLDYLETLLQKGELNNHFEIDLKSRRYYCPECTGKEGVFVQEDEKGNVIDINANPTSKWAFLSPNKSDSTNIFCLICQGNFSVDRGDCKGEDEKECKGNVLYVEEEAEIDEETGEKYSEEVKICLTCMDIQKNISTPND
jgi:hypothetical protein